jgi:two-component system nitrogen regulation response regulator NtrX
MLIRHFADQMVHQDRVPPKVVTAGAVDALTDREWPGNVRELKNTVERLLILSMGDQVTEDDVRQLVSAGEESSGLGAELLRAENFAEFRERAERAYILQKLREYDWNVAETARQIDMPRSNLYKKIDRYGLVRED